MAEQIPFTPSSDDVAAANRDAAADGREAPVGTVESQPQPRSGDTGAPRVDSGQGGGTEREVERSAFREPSRENRLDPDHLDDAE